MVIPFFLSFEFSVDQAFNTLGVLYREEGDIPRAISSYEACVTLDSNAANARHNKLFALNCSIHHSVDDVSRSHCDWGQAFTAHIMAQLPKALLEDKTFEPYTLSSPTLLERLRSISPHKPLKIGYISPDFFTHSVSFFIEAPLRHHVRSNVHVTCFSNVATPDSRTNELRALADTWCDILGKSTLDVAQLVREHEIDVLVELAGHTAGNRLDVLALCPAPVQVTWVGYPNTTGLPTIDYRITDATVDPPSSKQIHSETLWRLPRPFLAYTPATQAAASKILPPPCLRNNYITFGSFNSLSKINPTVQRVWARVLKCVPRSRLLIKSKAFVCQAVRDKFLRTMEALGVESSRIDLLGLFPHAQHFDAYGMMDISLDTFPYAGTTTTCECLHQGVPCVTLYSPGNHCHSVGATLVEAIGYPDWACATEGDFVKKAIELACDPPRLAQIRERLRSDMLASVLCDGKGMAEAVEAAFRGMVEAKLRRAEDPEEGSGMVHLPLGNLELMDADSTMEVGTQTHAACKRQIDETPSKGVLNGGCGACATLECVCDDGTASKRRKETVIDGDEARAALGQG
eukprot:c19019_g1_i5.p1 GENE.c19019_g1_i5~~c19019_g1_i5.p1  ORF type:complete len:574 (+),score=123.74 c19019_g1_i5:690-2411(+)